MSDISAGWDEPQVPRQVRFNLVRAYETSVKLGLGELVPS